MDGVAIFLTFLLGIANFAIHAAVRDTRHPMLAQMPERFGYVLEFAFLLAALLLVGNGQPGWVWAYLLYTMINGVAAWLILTRRI
jgi:hypothetical protein